MLRPRHALAVAFLLALRLASPALAEEEEENEGLRAHPVWATFQAGGMLPSGEQGEGLKTGYQMVGTLSLFMGPTFNIEGDLGLVSSNDDFRKRIVMIALDGRLNPSADWPQLYLRAGAGFYFIENRDQVPGVEPPQDLARPGLNFGVGYDFKSFSAVTVGVVGSYHGIVIARSDALSYVSLGAYISLRQPQ